MKRKLNEEDVPSEVAPNALDGTGSFAAFGLDPRLLQSISKEKFSKPTLVQEKAIPLALEGKDILGTTNGLMFSYIYWANTCIARAKTGSGKTAAYLLPILQSILRKKAVCQSSSGKVMVLKLFRLPQMKELYLLSY